MVPIDFCMFEAVYIKDKIYEHYIYIDQPAFCVFEAIFDDFSLNLYKNRQRFEIPLFPSCLQPCISVTHVWTHMCGCACAYADVHVCGGHPQPLYPHKKFEDPNPIGSRDMVHYVIGCKTLYVSNAKSMQTHKYVYITHNMPTHKFECPGKNLTLDKGNYRESAQIYVNM